MEQLRLVQKFDCADQLKPPQRLEKQEWHNQCTNDMRVDITTIQKLRDVINISNRKNDEKKNAWRH